MSTATWFTYWEQSDTMQTSNNRYRDFKKALETKVTVQHANDRIVEYEPTSLLLKSFANAEEDISRGNVSPVFSNAEDAIQWLEQDE